MCSTEKNWKLPFNPLHLEYWIFILILVNIGIVAYYFSGDTNLTSIIAFAATIASIILSILAIFMTIISNNSIGGMLHKVRDMHEAVASIPDSLNKTIVDLNNTTSGLMSVNTEVNKAIAAIGRKLEDFESHLSENDNKIDEVLSTIATVKSASNNKSEYPSEKLIEQYLNMLSLNGLFLLYGISVYQEKEKTGVFSLEAFAKSLFGAEPAYLHGILVASGSANIISYNTIEDTNNMDIINLSLYPLIKKEVISKRIELVCADIISRYVELKDHYDAKVRERKICEYIDTIS